MCSKYIYLSFDFCDYIRSSLNIRTFINNFTIMIIILFILQQFTIKIFIVFVIIHNYKFIRILSLPMISQQRKITYIRCRRRTWNLIKIKRSIFIFDSFLSRRNIIFQKLMNFSNILYKSDFYLFSKYLFS